MNGSVVTSPAGGAGHQPLAMLREYLDRLRVNNKQLPRRNGRPNKLAIAKRCGNEDQSQTRERMVFRKAGLNLLELGEALREPWYSERATYHCFHVIGNYSRSHVEKVLVGLHGLQAKA